MSRTATQFEPAVTVSALALNNLKQLPYYQLRLSPTPSTTSPVAIRAKFLEHGVGSHTAFHAAALAELADSVPAVLAVSVPHSHPPLPASKNTRRPPSNSLSPSPPSLWIFAPFQVLNAARDLLTPDFTVVNGSKWTNSSSASVTRALTMALDRAIASAMQSENALRVGNHILHPQSSLACTFNITQGHGPDPNILIHVTARHLPVRYIDDDDCVAALGAPQIPLSVFTTPLGLKGSLASRPCAGDALSVSVIRRWREAGLLPKEIADTTVVFLKLDDGLEVPFPRACVLTTEMKQSRDPTITPKCPSDQLDANDVSSKKHIKPNVSLWQSRKRPRSPISTSEENEVLGVSKDKHAPETPPSVVEDNISNNAPTAASISEALQLAESDENDSAVHLHHPLIEPIPPHSFHDAPVRDTAVERPDQPLLDISSIARRSASFVNEKTMPGSVKATPIQSPGIFSAGFKNDALLADQGHHGLDAFYLGTADGSHHESVSGIDSSAGIDINDIAAFDEDVSVFFRDHTDSRYSLFASDDPPRTPAFLHTESLPKREASENDVLGLHQSNAKVTGPEGRMDVDSMAQYAVDNEQKKEDEQDAPQTLKIEQGTATIIDSALASLKQAVPNTKAAKEVVKSQLSSLYEDDVLRRRTANLKASRTIAKRKPRSFAESRQIFVTKSALKSSRVETQRILSTLRASKIKDAPKQLLPSFEPCVSGDIYGHYVPRRILKRYINLRRKGLRFQTTSLLNDGYDSDSSSSETGDDNSIKTAELAARSKANSSGKSENIGLSLSSLPEIKTGLSSRGPANAKPELSTEYDPSKIVDSVAVDCASVCMVLAAERANNCSTTMFSSESSSSAVGGDGEGSLGISRESESKTLNSSAPLNNFRSAASNLYPRSSVAGSLTGSPSNRFSKKDREFFSLLSLLEMQAFGHHELEMFNEGTQSKAREVVDSNSVDALSLTKNSQSEKVSQATMRRLLLGLTRTLEMSDTFKAWVEAFRDSDTNGPVPSVQGPLSVNAFLGRAAIIFPLSPAYVCVGYDKDWIETDGAALPLWEKAGLEPYSGPKNVEYVALGPKELEEDVKVFLKDISSVYEECSFGKHAAIPDSMTLISSSIPRVGASNKGSSEGALHESDKAMAEQYHMAINSLPSKLLAFAKEKRKSLSGTPTNIVVYVISPFDKSMSAANAVLLQVVAPLFNNVTGMVSSFPGLGAPSSLPAAPWRNSAASKSVISLTVRMIPREVVDRRFVGQADVDYLFGRPLRPQLIKAVCFAVFSSIRYKRIRPTSLDGEVGTALARGAILPDDLMSPMTPEVMGDAVTGPYGTPVSPIAVSNEEGNNYSMSMAGNAGGHIDQSWALSPSYLHEGAVVLAGVGRHIGQTSERANMVIHLGYCYCENWSRYVFAWTDHRGELLDSATVPVAKPIISHSRRKAFWGMWTRGQRWRLSYVEDVHATICKLGVMSAEELEDWEWVMNKVVCSSYGGSESKTADGREKRVVRRFPPLQISKSGEDILDAYSDVPTPATPGMMQSNGVSNGKGSSMETRLSGVNSVSILSLSEADTHMLMEKAVDGEDVDRRDFAIISDISMSKENTIKSQTNIILARFIDDGIGAVEVNILRHYGIGGDGQDMVDDRCVWDSYGIEDIAKAIAVNFHELRYIASAPCWPVKRWLTKLPLHLEAVRSMEVNLTHVYSHIGSSVNIGAR